MSMPHSIIWVKTSLLKDAVKTTDDEHTKKLVVEYINNRDDKWDWSRAGLIEGTSLNFQEDLILIIVDCKSPYQILIPIEVVNKYSLENDDDAIVMANGFHEEGSVPPDDLVNLTHLHAPALVSSLKTRFEAGEVYTATGSILIAVNPFQKRENLYNSNTMQKYMNHHAGLARDSDDSLPPHVYAIAGEAFRSMRRDLEEAKLDPNVTCCDQSILISGESGAGKTVTTKHVMNYIATLSQGNKCDSSPKARRPQLRKSGISSRSIRTSRRMSRQNITNISAVMIGQKILQANPMLESFGNARTVRNDNSSRFGKFIELQFDKKSGHLVGTKIDTYLLEKVRLIHQGEGERNYHVFYETLAAADDSDRDKYLLDQFTADDFKLTNQSQIYDRRDGVDDLDQFDDLVLSMAKMGFNEKDQESIFEIICALLHASNTTFTSTSGEDSELSLDNVHLTPTTTLLGVTLESFGNALCKYYLNVGKERHQCRQPKHKAEKCLEALMKAVYSALFEYLVNEINFCVNSKHPRNQLAHIGVLDIFGFESFKKNSFEQLCINYCNEALQQQFNLYVFKSEQEEYKAEGISWDFIEFPDNQNVLELIEMKRTGIISILDDQCKAPGTTDKTFGNRLYQTCKTSPRFEANHRQIALNLFGIKHYAGSVEYDIMGFIEKNKEDVPREIIEFFESSSKPILKNLAKYHKKSNDVSSSISGSSRKGSSRVTVGGQFKAQLHSLRQRIDQTSPHYIRCLKPNSLLVPEMFMSQMISEQLESAGVLEAIRVSRLGYPQRFSHVQFYDQFHFIGGKRMLTPAIKSMDLRSKCEIIINAAVDNISSKTSNEDNKIKSKESDTVPAFQLGVTKVFLRQSAFIELTNQRAQSLESAICCIQSQIRRFIAKRDFEYKMKQIILIQSSVRMFLSKRQMTRILLMSELKKRPKLEREKRQRFERHLLFAQPLDEVDKVSVSETTTDLTNDQSYDSLASEKSAESTEVVTWIESFKGTSCFLDYDGSKYCGISTTKKRSGLGVLYHVYGHRDVMWFENNEPRGHGVRSNKAGTVLWRLYDGQKYGVLSENAASKIIESLEYKQAKLNK